MDWRSSAGRKSITGDHGTVSEGCYLLRSNVLDWSPEELWRVYIQLTDGRGCLSHSEIGSTASTDLAQEPKQGRSTHPGAAS